MDRDILNLFLQSGSARKLDVCRFTMAIASSGGSDQPYLFQNKFLNYAILFKRTVAGGDTAFLREKSISTVIYMPYDARQPYEGGESFVFSQKSFCRHYAHKLDAANTDRATVEHDLEILKILDSLPTFSPLIMELAFERKNMSISSAYVDLKPELRVKLRAQLKGRIRPMIVAVYDRSSLTVEKAVEDITDKLLCVRDVSQILPLVRALHLPLESAGELLSSWIGITHLEYEYSMIQNHLKEFAAWLADSSNVSEYASTRDRSYVGSLMDIVKAKLRVDWKRIYNLSNEYRETYNGLVYTGDIEKFSSFVRKCQGVYWELGDLLGRFEQTAIAWQALESSHHGKRVPFPILANFLTLLRKLHDAPGTIATRDRRDRIGLSNLVP
jgi:hypothetical protein